MVASSPRDKKFRMQQQGLCTARLVYSRACVQQGLCTARLVSSKVCVQQGLCTAGLVSKAPLKAHSAQVKVSICHFRCIFSLICMSSLYGISKQSLLHLYIVLVVSNCILTSCQPHRVTSRQFTLC